MYRLLMQADPMSAPVQSEGGPLVPLFLLGLMVFSVAVGWKIFTKAGHPGWASLVPFYNIYLLCKIAGRPNWWLLMLLIPLVNVVFAIILTFDLAAKFGKSGGFGVALLLLGPVFYPILAFGEARYVGAEA